MRRYYISEMDDRAQGFARSRGMGVELIAFCCPENMENTLMIAEKKAQIAGLYASVHAPYYEIFPSAIDPMIRDVAMHRLHQAAEVCAQLGVKRMVVHSGYAPQMYYPQWFVPKSIAFWKEFMSDVPGNMEILLENVLDICPDHIRDVVDGVQDDRFSICLDVGHANAYSEIPLHEWIEELGSRIKHVHLHNNFGDADSHNALHRGSIDVQHILQLLDVRAPEASICIESLDAAACLNYLSERGIIDDSSL